MATRDTSAETAVSCARGSVAKNSSAATIRSPDEMGTAIAAAIPTSRANDARSIFSSDFTSSTHTGCRAAQACPGKPLPSSNVIALLRSVKGANPESDGQAAANSRYVPPAIVQA